jgi:DNA primase
METYDTIRSVKYIEQIIAFAEDILGLIFKKSGTDKYSSYCPFHKDSTDSFRVYVNQKGIVRFHCFGTCAKEWDIFDIIQKRYGCGFREAQRRLAQYLQQDIEIFHGNSSPAPEKLHSVTEEPTDNESSVDFAVPVELEPQIFDALERASSFYNQFLADSVDGKPLNYLLSRGVTDSLIQKYRIGYAPAYGDPKHEGKALLNEYLPRFKDDHLVFNAFNRAGLFRLLADETTKSYPYYSQFIDHSMGIFGLYGDYFAGRITFPVHDINGRVCGFMGRKMENRGVRWVKQQTTDTALNPKSWLYGIDKAYQNIIKYRTVVLVEGIFDYFAFLRIHQDQNRPIVVSTLGARLTDEALNLFKILKVKNFIVAYDWDDAGKKAISSIAGQIGDGCSVSYLGGMPEGQDPADFLKNSVNAIDGFSLAHLLAGAEKAQALTKKTVHIDFITTGSREERSVQFSPVLANSEIIKLPPEEKPRDCLYDANILLPMLAYDHGNKSLIEAKIGALVAILESRPQHKDVERIFTLPPIFVEEQRYLQLGSALILWLKIAIEQQYRKRRLKMTDGMLAEDLRTTRATIQKYKSFLRDAGYLVIDTGGKVQKLSVKYFVI